MTSAARRRNRNKLAALGSEQWRNIMEAERERFLSEMRRPVERGLPDGITVRRVPDIYAIPQGRTNFGEHGGATTTVTTIAIDYVKGRSCK